MIRCMKDQYSVPLPPIQVTRKKAITHSYTIWDRLSLDTAFLANAVKNLWVVLSFNARKAIPHYTKTRKNELRERVPVPHDNFLKSI